MSDIYTQLAAVMADCKAVAKRDRQEQQRFLFRGVDAVVNAVGPILRKHRVIVVPDVEDVSYDPVQTSTGKPSTACRVLVKYTFYAEDGTHISARVAAESWDSGDKAAPKAMSVAFRTALLQALALPTDDHDPDAAPAPVAAGEPVPTRRMSRPERTTETGLSAAEKKMFALLGQTGRGGKDAALAFISGKTGRDITSRTDLTPSELSTVIKALEAELEGANA